MKYFGRIFLVVASFYCLLFISCERDEMYETPQQVDSLAVFTLMSADSPCVVITSDSIFVKGKPLTSSQKIQFDIKVSKTGYWSLTTDTANDFFFSGKGNFIDTGRKTITLTASGTPIIAGTEYFSITAGNTRRSIAVPVIKTDIIEELVPLTSYFKAKIGGVDNYVEAPKQGPDDITYGRGGVDTVSFASFINNINQATPGSVTIQKGMVYNYPNITEAEFKAFFKPGGYPFVLSRCTNIYFAGITIIWGQPQTNEIWHTANPTSDQRGSSFTIVGVEDGHNSKGNYFVKVKSTFNCRLYNIRTGEMKELTNGEMVSYFFKN